MYTEKELSREKITELRRIAADLGIEYEKHWIRKKLIKEILNKQAGEVHVEPQPEAQQPANPEFERAAAEKAAEPVKDNRGGARPGAGRPLGLTDEKAKVKNLPQYPSNPIRQGLCCLFDLWAAAAKIEELALSDDEADMLSLPLTQLQEYYFPGILPEIAGTWIMLIFAASRIMKPRIKIINKTREQRHAKKENKPEPEKTEIKNPNHISQLLLPESKWLHAVEIGEKDGWTTKREDVTCETCIKLMRKNG